MRSGIRLFGLFGGLGLLALLAAGPALAGAASVALSGADGTVLQTSNSAWSLTKTGAVDPISQTVVWTITASKVSTTSGQLVVDGVVAVTNSGSGDASVGNVVVNLQTRSADNSWVTSASDVADATHGDAATTAVIDPHASSEGLSSFTESAASGALSFTDADTNTVFSLVPEETIAPGATVELLFSATFDNHVLALPVGTPIRAEAIVSFGGAGAHGRSASDVDINGNGTIDPDEATVRSVPARLGFQVPAPVSTNAAPTLADSASDIATTGTVTYSNPTFALGATSGLAIVSYDGGTSGGTITNCAHLTGTGTTTTLDGYTFPAVGGVQLQACDTEDINPAACTPGTPGCGWSDGDMTTYGNVGWSGDPGSVLTANYYSVYASTFGVVEIGIPGTAGYSTRFSSASHVLDYLPATGPNGALDADLGDPTSTSSGAFGGIVLALRLDIDFSAAGALASNTGLHFGDLTLCGYTELPSLDGKTVSDISALANTLLGGGSNGYTIDDLAAVSAELNNAFSGGVPDAFAQAHVVNGPCP